MSRISPMKRKDLIRYLQYLRFEGPYFCGKHQLMLKGNLTLRVPDPRQRNVGKELLARSYGMRELDGRRFVRSRREWSDFKKFWRRNFRPGESFSNLVVMEVSGAISFPNPLMVRTLKNVCKEFGSFAISILTRKIAPGLV